MPNPYGKWVHDPLAPSGFRWRRHNEVPATHMLPIIEPSPVLRDVDPDRMPPETEHGHGDPESGD